ncbi:MAG: hypothetical protein U0263_09765 [Polyangiaceae bacterium]
MKNALSRFARAAEEVARPPESPSDSVDLSSSKSADLPGALLDLRVQKYAVVANLRALETANDVEDATLEIGKSR